MKTNNGQKIGILRIILQQENTTQTILYQSIKRECDKLGIGAITRTEISHFCFADRPNMKMGTYLKILLGLNAIRKRQKPYTLEDIVEKDEIFSILQTKKNR